MKIFRRALKAVRSRLASSSVWCRRRCEVVNCEDEEGKSEVLQTRGGQSRRVLLHTPSSPTITVPSSQQQPQELLISPMAMAEQSIKSLFSSAESQRKDIEASWDSNTAAYQQNLAAAIATYDDCLQLADRLSLFSPNETLEDLTSGNLQCVFTAVSTHPANI